ncbi:MAG TPA: hypothetical protein VMU94_07550 [Streptosporangiaceae bacterium]|nr:hypothetical protein [Streptosporangiaceae bacterium]
MTWLTWRQFRPQAIAAGAVLAVLGAVLLVSGLSLAHLDNSTGLAACPAHHDCASLASSFLRQARSGSYDKLHGLAAAIVLLAPAVIGMFWGAPLITREIETALGVTAGVLVRRTVPAMAVTLAAFAAVQLAWPSWIRPHLIAPVHAVLALGKVSLGGFGEGPGNGLFLTVGSKGDGWILSSHAANAAGQAISRVPGGCSTQTGGPGTFLACLARKGVRVAVTYQPGSRYWTFQWYETAIFLVLAAALAGFCYWRVSRRALA